jgi:hypothetical protein
MPRAVCPHCGQPIKMQPTGIKQNEGFSAEWWWLETHPSKAAGETCKGSGKRI